MNKAELEKENDRLQHQVEDMTIELNRQLNYVEYLKEQIGKYQKLVKDLNDALDKKPFRKIFYLLLKKKNK